MQVLLQSRHDGTDALDARSDESVLASLPADHPLLRLQADFAQLNTEILALHTEPLPPAVIHRISRGAQEQAAFAEMMLEDCIARAEEGSLNPVHIENTQKWIAGVRRWIEYRRNEYTLRIRRKLCVVRPARLPQ